MKDSFRTFNVLKGAFMARHLRAALQNQLADSFGVGLAFGGFHDGADYGAGGGVFAAADLFGDVGLGGEGFVDGGVEGGVVGNHGQAAFFDDFGGVAFTGQDAVDDFAGEF